MEGLIIFMDLRLQMINYWKIASAEFNIKQGHEGTM